MGLRPNIRYGTERYPEKVARRLRAVNIAAWAGAAVPAYFAVLRFLDPPASRRRAAERPRRCPGRRCLPGGIDPVHRHGRLHPARASDTTPEELVRFLNDVFTKLDALVERHGLEKIKTTGDAYMVVSGVPEPRSDHAEALAELALDIRDALVGLVDPKGREVPVRIGIASGPVVAGVVGTRKFFYDVWGDTVSIASRMESTGEAGKIQVAVQTYEQLVHRFDFEERGVIEVKGRVRCEPGS